MRVFEIGRVINQDGVENEHLAGVAIGMEYKNIAEMVTALFAHLGIGIKYQLQQSGLDILHPKNQAQIILNNKVIGSIGIIHPQVMTNAVGFEVNLSAIDFEAVPHMKAPVLSKFPKTEFDFTFVWDRAYSELEAIWDKFSHPLVTKYCLSGVYENKFTLKFTVSSLEKTLDKAEINKIHQEIVDFATKNSVHLG